MQLPRLFVKDPAEAPPAAAAGVAEAAGAQTTKPVAARAELEGEKRLADGASWRWREPADEACRMGGTGRYRQVTITEKEGGVGEEDQPHPPLVCVGWGGKGQMAESRCGGNGCDFFCVCLG